MLSDFPSENARSSKCSLMITTSSREIPVVSHHLSTTESSTCSGFAGSFKTSQNFLSFRQTALCGAGPYFHALFWHSGEQYGTLRHPPQYCSFCPLLDTACEQPTTWASIPDRDCPYGIICGRERRSLERDGNILPLSSQCGEDQRVIFLGIFR